MAQTIKRASKICSPFIVTKGKKFRLKNCDPNYAKRFSKKEKAELKAFFPEAQKCLARQQVTLFYDEEHGLLAIYQGYDASGKGGTIKYSMAQVDPRGYRVVPHGPPTSKQLRQSMMQRSQKEFPSRGQMVIFDRSYYENALVVRVNPKLLEKVKLPKDRTGKELWDEHFRTFNSQERSLYWAGIHVCKILLHVSRKEQKKRFDERMRDPLKRHKVSVHDVAQRAFWAKYQHAFEEMVRNTSTEIAPWVVIPADKKWFARLVATCYMIKVMNSMKLKLPKLTAAQAEIVKTARKQLAAQK